MASSEQNPFAKIPIPHPSGETPDNSFADIQIPPTQSEQLWVDESGTASSLSLPSSTSSGPQYSPESNNLWWSDVKETNEQISQEITLPPVPDSFILQKGLLVELPDHGHFNADPWRKVGAPIDPEYYDDIAAAGKGWKLHLNFDAADPNKKVRVETFLKQARTDGMITTFKIGDGGGVEYEQPGKEATVYVGHKDKTTLAAHAIKEGLSDILLPQTEDVAKDDIPFAGDKVYGRFEVYGNDNDFHQYGAEGVPILRDDVAEIAVGANSKTYKGVSGTEARKMYWMDAAERAKGLLAYRYGVFFTGSIDASSESKVSSANAHHVPEDS